MTTTGDDRCVPIYVGYLPLPRRHARFLRVAIPVLLWLLLAVNTASVLGMRSMGAGVWETDERTWAGTLYERPYPHLVVDENGRRRVLLLVEMNKIGAQRRVAGFGGAPVQVRGFLLERDGQGMIELAPDNGALARAHGPVLTVERTGGAGAARGEGGGVTLRGEIIDAKCFLGAMKPGAGPAHRACARLCIAGGIPPMLAAADERGRRVLYLVTGPDGEPMPEELLDRIGFVVELNGEVGRIGPLATFAVAPATGR